MENIGPSTANQLWYQLEKAVNFEEGKENEDVIFRYTFADGSVLAIHYDGSITEEETEI